MGEDCAWGQVWSVFSTVADGSLTAEFSVFIALENIFSYAGLKQNDRGEIELVDVVVFRLRRLPAALFFSFV